MNKSRASDMKHVPRARVELILRILYSFGKMSSASVKEEYAGIATRIMNAAIDDIPENLDLSAKSGIEGMSQILLAMFCTNGDNSTISLMDALKQSESSIIPVIQEACVREARQRFRMKSGGDKLRAKEMAIEFLTTLLGVTNESAPATSSLMESEPHVDCVRMDCDDSVYLNSDMAKEQTLWVRNVAIEWCRVWSFICGFHGIIHKRHGGWEEIEHKMETGLHNFEGIVDELNSIMLESPKEFFRSLYVDEIQSLFLNIGVKAIFAGVLGEPLQSHVWRTDYQGTLQEAAREIRMKIYFERVKKKLSEWRTVGEESIFFEARAADISAFSGMCSSHVHGLDKQTFWGLWRAAKNTKNETKILTFLSTANESFFHKHYNGKDLLVDEDKW